MNPISRVLILMALSLMLALAVPVIVLAIYSLMFPIVGTTSAR